MNRTIKTIMVCAAALLLSATMVAQPAGPHHGKPHHGGHPAPLKDSVEAVSGATHSAQPGMPGHEPMHHPMMQREPMQFVPCHICYIPEGFVLIDSVDNAIELVGRRGGEMRRVGSYRVDEFKGRHDLQNIQRPKSVQVVGNHIVFLASAQDSSYIGVLEMPRPCPGDKGCNPDAACEEKSAEVLPLQLVASRGFKCHSNAFNLCPRDGELIVVGDNNAGYDINILKLDDGLQNLAAAELLPFHYHVPKQSERIQASDPYGVGLTVVAVLVVFFALVCIAIVLKLFGKAVTRIQNSKRDTEFSKTLVRTINGIDDEVYAAIAAAIYLYEADLHDEEDNVLTIQKVERAWTPWNAKFYNMNRYFINQGR